MKNSNSTLFAAIVAAFSMFCYVFVSAERDKQEAKCEKEKQKIEDVSNEQMRMLQNENDTLRVEFAYYKMSSILDTAKSLSDLGAVVDIMKWESDSTYMMYRGTMDRHHDVIGRLYKLGIQFFSSEVKKVRNEEEWKKFLQEYKYVGIIVPIYGCGDMKTFDEKLLLYGKG